MGKYVVRRLLITIPLLVAITFMSFVLINLSNTDIAVAVLRSKGTPDITPEMIEATNIELGLNEPFFIRYFTWIGKCLKLDFGESYLTGEKVFDMILPAFGYTIRLAFIAAGIVIVVSVILGVICALKEGTIADKIIRIVMITIGAMPAYWIGILLIWLLAVKLDLLPTSGVGDASNYVLPLIVLSIGYIGFYFRLIRNSMITNRQSNYVMYERACGLPEKTVVKHVLKNSLQTAVSAFCMAIPGMIAGTVVVENVFAWPGVGRLCVSSISSHDIPVIQAYIMIVAVAFVIFNLLADIINAALNPRLRGG